jgi:hypothetical protein
MPTLFTVFSRSIHHFKEYMMSHILQIILASLLLTGFAACGDKDPGDDEDSDNDDTASASEDNTQDTDDPDDGNGGDSTDGDGESDDGETGNDNPGLALEDDYYPMAEDLQWQYAETTASGTIDGTVTYTVTGKENMAFDFVEDNRDVFEVQAERSYTLEWTLQYIENNEDFATRLMHRVYNDTLFTKQRDFKPGFLRFHRVKMLEQDNVFEEYIERYQDIDPENDDVPATGPEYLTYEYTVKSVGTTVEVQGTTYEDCVEIERYNNFQNLTEIKNYWFCKGIGKVKEITTNPDMLKTEELISCSLCD